jgi:hypothetical protein
MRVCELSRRFEKDGVEQVSVENVTKKQKHKEVSARASLPRMADLDETKPLLGPINEGDDEPKLKFTAKVVVWLKANFNPKMLALLSVLIVIATANRVSFKVLTNSMDFRQSYLTFTNQVPLFVVCLVIVAPMDTNRPIRTLC